MSRPYDLASLTALTCFESAARHLSFKAAARETNVTPAAVSHQIKALELDLGCLLFQRRHRGVALTEKGAFLLVAVQRGFEAISAAVTQLRDRPQAVDVSIHVTTAVSALWLTPKITAFWKSHPDITLSQSVTDVAGDAGDHDVSIGYMPEQPGSDQSHVLFHDRIFAAATPRFAAEHGITGLADLHRAPLIQIKDDYGNEWTDWPQWLTALGQPAPRGRSFYVNNHMIALQAAQDDIGAVLAWGGLMAGLLPQRRLIRLVEADIAAPVPFCIRLHARASTRARLFAQWLVRDAAPAARL